MTTAQRPIVNPQQGANRGHIRQCAHPGYIECLAQRHDAPKSLAEIMGSRTRPCHHINGVPVPYGAWVPPGQRDPIGTLHAIRLEHMEEQEEDASWLL